MENKFDWIPFYTELADKLLVYKDKRNELFEIMESFVAQNDKFDFLHFEKTEWWEPRNNEMDPLTVFSVFNRGKISTPNRIKIAELYAEKFKVSASIPSNFDGIPVMNWNNAFFNGPDEIWELYEEAIICADTGVFSLKFATAFEKAINVHNNGLATITMGLFWIRANTFLNLDEQNKEVLTNTDSGLSSVTAKLPKSIKKYVPTGEEYIFMINEMNKLLKSGELKFKSLPEMSSYAWLNKAENSIDEKAQKVSKANFLKWFKPLIQALKDLGGTATPREAIDKIAKNENLDEKTLNEVRGKNNLKKFDNEVQWARNYLSYAGIIDKSERGKWKLTEKGKLVEMTDELASQIFRKKWWVETDDIENDIISKKRYWLYSPGEQARLWNEFYDNGIMGIGWDELENLKDYSSREEIINTMQHLSGEEKSFRNDSLASWQFANSINVGDIIIVKRGYSKVLGRGKVTSDYMYDEARDEYKHIRLVEWTNKGEWDHPGQAVQKALTDITQYTEYVEKLEMLFNDDEKIIEDDVKVVYPLYTKENFLSHVFMNDNSYETLKVLLSRKKNIILQGAPGVGKTYAAKRLAYSIMGERDTSRVEMIQFHQSYAYEDFIMGYRPNDEGFKLGYGAFYKFCKKAQDDIEQDYFFIIDEINRGNLSKIFGELFMLIEHDKRDERNSMRLLYADEQFYIPSNVHIIGMMNTADRSLAMLDYALRRRFAFFEMEPAFNSDGFKQYQDTVKNEKFNKLIEVVKNLNEDIKKDASLGAGFRIGHSYFIKNDSDVVDDSWLEAVVNYEVIPLISEYWFDEISKVEEWSKKLLEAIV